jgi:hypothetical protein
MSNLSNLNYNHISVKPESTVKLIKELSKLGVFKKKSKKRPKSTVADAIYQDNNMVGYVKSLGGPQLRNIIPLQQITAGMTQQQIEDTQRINAARFAALEGEVQQQRSETQETIGGLAGAASNKFRAIESTLGKIIDPATERFRGSTFPAQASGDEPIDPFATRRPGVIYLGNIPETQDVPMSETLNEGAPEPKAEFATTLYPPTEEESIPSGGGASIPEPRLQPLGRIKPGKPTRTQFLAVNGLSPLPPNNKLTTLQNMKAYYSDFNQVFALDDDSSIYSNKAAMYNKMVADLDDLINLSI